MDIWLDPSNENKLIFFAFLKIKNFSKQGMDRINELDFTKHLAFHIGENESRIDFLTKITGVTFLDAIQQVEFLPLRTIKISVIHYNHLIINKMPSGRNKDKLDVDELQNIWKYKE